MNRSADGTFGLTRSLRHGQALGEQVDDVMPGSLRMPRVVSDAGEHGVVDRRVVEGMQGAAVDHEAPVDARGLHLGRECVPLRGRHDRVFRPDPGPHRAADARRLVRSAVVSPLTVPIARRLTPSRPSSSAIAPPVP